MYPTILSLGRRTKLLYLCECTSFCQILHIDPLESYSSFIESKTICGVTDRTDIKGSYINFRFFLSYFCCLNDEGSLYPTPRNLWPKLLVTITLTLRDLGTIVEGLRGKCPCTLQCREGPNPSDDLQCTNEGKETFLSGPEYKYEKKKVG